METLFLIASLIIFIVIIDVMITINQIKRHMVEQLNKQDKMIQLMEHLVEEQKRK